jgi:uncharacterized protein (DUF983 family)
MPTDGCQIMCPHCPLTRLWADTEEAFTTQNKVCQYDGFARFRQTTDLPAAEVVNSTPACLQGPFGGDGPQCVIAAPQQSLCGVAS